VRGLSWDGGSLRRARAELDRMGKPREIEELLDLYVIRPGGFAFVQVLRHTRITPNMVSVAALLAGVAVGLSYLAGYGTLIGAWLGLGFMVLHSWLDSADGQLARVTGQTSPWGRTVDGLCDNVSFIAIYTCLFAAHCLHGGVSPLPVFTLTLLAGISHSTHCALTEFQRMLFLTYCKGGHVTLDEQPERWRAQLAAARRAGSWSKRLVNRLHLNYALQQRTLLATSDVVERAWAGVVRDDPARRAAFARRYREEMERPLGAWALLGPNSHKVALVAAAFLPALAGPGPLGDWLRNAGMLPYLVYDLVVLNAVTVGLILWQRRTDRRLLAWIVGTAPRSGA
jgi:phosphatidylglycerophosphate synthase